jgi:hypothetical protein
MWGGSFLSPVSKKILLAAARARSGEESLVDAVSAWHARGLRLDRGDTWVDDMSCVCT